MWLWRGGLQHPSTCLQFPAVLWSRLAHQLGGSRDSDGTHLPAISQLFSHSLPLGGGSNNVHGTSTHCRPVSLRAFLQQQTVTIVLDILGRVCRLSRGKTTFDKQSVIASTFCFQPSLSLQDAHQSSALEVGNANQVNHSELYFLAQC